MKNHYITSFVQSLKRYNFRILQTGFQKIFIPCQQNIGIGINGSPKNGTVIHIPTHDSDSLQLW